MRKLQIFVPQVSDLFFLRDTRDAAIDGGLFMARLYDEVKQRPLYLVKPPRASG
jgi:hypothetical protein